MNLIKLENLKQLKIFYKTKHSMTDAHSKQILYLFENAALNHVPFLFGKLMGLVTFYWKN